MKSNNLLFIFIFLFFISIPFLNAQSAEQVQPRTIRITWSGGDNSLRYQVVIERNVNGSFRSFLREYTESTFFIVSLMPGEYRYRIIPYDVINRPSTGTQWINFEVKFIPPPEPEPEPEPEAEEFEETEELEDSEEDYIEYEFSGAEIEDWLWEEIELELEKEEEERRALEEIREEIQEKEPEEEPVPSIPNSPRFHSIGISGGSSFIDPLAIVSIHGTISPFKYTYLELGCDFGFISIYEQVEKFYCIYPYANLGFFIPFKTKGGLFIGAGGGYMTGLIDFSFGQAEIDIIAYNAAVGINIGNIFNISYTLITDLERITNKASIGFVYRFLKKERVRKSDTEIPEDWDELSDPLEDESGTEEDRE